MKNILKNIEGDRAIWAIVTILAVLSFLPVYSASTNLVYVVNNGTTTFHLFKHAFLLICGFLIIYAVHKIPFRYFSGGSVLMIPLVIFLLIYTITQGTTIGGANASRWIQIPFIGIGFQTSTLAGLVLMVYVARYLARNKDNENITFKETALQLWLPVACILALILPANFSTTAIVFCMILLLSFIGGYPLKYIASVVGIGVLSLTLFVLVAKAFPDAMPNRVDTWMSRIENFSNKNAEEGYQVEKAKIAIASGGLQGRGPGKSIQKNFLPQSSSDFIFAIIVEEYGLLGASVVILMYFLLLFRIVMAAKKATSIFATLLIIGVGLPIIFQAIINMAVAVNLFPVTGQTLPLISSGGTSIWMTCFALGIILSVTADKEKKESIDNDENPLDILHEAIG
ncbi:MAG: FtsW/RodA/SpoVE family cell cycle protein [Lutibacter sp.]|uniref:FtsW/RodA/SpoVE family cell cycle protein n=1 Tax=Lutibacter sp. TaxID=1925666 RepID=UPI00183E624D|nr:FtsW/RodA/SpoVE family cell cycle protein [Lutibacter sp.]MBT8316395.1 FtsW/RodA/SpoVE family cell cycle protein [Lutibacter sp.]NNJ57255.1 FtsW/RodA/SpoVE family cell cycle protein [Lutibacter sp.]